MNYQLHVMIN